VPSPEVGFAQVCSQACFLSPVTPVERESGKAAGVSMMGEGVEEGVAAA